ncbi:MAG: hypothetical protein ABH800_00470 [Candidatus Nealsonbacteria bacterium]
MIYEKLNSFVSEDAPETPTEETPVVSEDTEENPGEVSENSFVLEDTPEEKTEESEDADEESSKE